MIEEFGDAMDDEEDGRVILFAVAALQMERGRVEEPVRRRALTAVEEGAHLARWEEVGGEALAGRRQVIEEFRQRLLRGG